MQFSAANRALSNYMPMTTGANSFLSLAQPVMERFDPTFLALPSNLQNQVSNKPSGLFEKHPVSVLQELCTRRLWNPPIYNLVYNEGPDHLREFQYEVSVNSEIFRPKGTSKTKKAAKTVSAEKAIEDLRRRNLP